MEEQLIKLVEEHEYIYNRGLGDYRNKEKKERAWSLIATTIGVGVKQCQGRWRSLRDRYLRECTEKEPGAERKWKYYKLMSFLRDHLAPRKLPLWKSDAESKDGSKKTNCFASDLVFKKNEDLQLIYEVKKYREIYDRNSYEYRRKESRVEAWIKISESLRKSEGSCQARWRSLRDRYVRIRLNKIMHKKNAEEQKREWQYFRHLGFLKSCISTRKSLRSVQESSDIQSEEDFSVDEDDIINADTDVENFVEDALTEVSNAEYEDCAKLYDSVQSDAETSVGENYSMDDSMTNLIEFPIKQHDEQQIETKKSATSPSELLNTNQSPTQVEAEELVDESVEVETKTVGDAFDKKAQTLKDDMSLSFLRNMLQLTENSTKLQNKNKHISFLVLLSEKLDELPTAAQEDFKMLILNQLHDRIKEFKLKKR